MSQKEEPQNLKDLCLPATYGVQVTRVTNPSRKSSFCNFIFVCTGKHTPENGF